MKIGLLSDTHDHLSYIRKAVEAFNDLQVAQVLHAGDYVAPFVVDALQHLKMPLHGIFGNNDGERIGLKNRLTAIGSVQVQPLFLELGGRRIAMVHEPEPVLPFARSGLYEVVIYGHTHRPEVRQEGNCLVINPGEVCGWLTGKPTVAVLDLETLRCELLAL